MIDFYDEKGTGLNLKERKNLVINHVKIKAIIFIYIYY